MANVLQKCQIGKCFENAKMGNVSYNKTVLMANLLKLISLCLIYLPKTMFKNNFFYIYLDFFLNKTFFGAFYYTHVY